MPDDDAADRPRRGVRAAAPALAPGKAGQGPTGADLWRARHRQVAPDRGTRGALRGEPHASLRYFCSPHHQDSALYPIVTRWEQDLGFARGDTPQERLHRLETALMRDRSVTGGRRADRRSAVGAGGRSLSALGFQPAAQEGKDVRGAARVLTERAPSTARSHAVRGRPLGGCQFARAAGQGIIAC